MRDLREAASLVIDQYLDEGGLPIQTLSKDRGIKGEPCKYCGTSKGHNSEHYDIKEIQKNIDFLKASIGYSTEALKSLHDHVKFKGGRKTGAWSGRVRKQEQGLRSAKQALDHWTSLMSDPHKHRREQEERDSRNFPEITLNNQ